MHSIYLDANATTPLLPAVREAMSAFQDGPSGNPASAHRFGRRARQALEDARERVASLLGAFPDEVVFTSGATEANNLALFGLAGDPPGHLIASPLEHTSVSEPLARLVCRGFELDTLPVSRAGEVDPAALETLRRPTTRLVTVMLVNHETGAIQPVQELARTSNGCPFHCDAVQAVGKLLIHFHTLAVSTLALSAHKFHGPPGIGALLVRRGLRLPALLHGGHQQQGLRPGTEPVALIVGMACALEIACQEREQRLGHARRLRRAMLDRLEPEAGPLVVNSPESGSPHVLNLSFVGLSADGLLMALDLAGVACSAGSACSSGSLLPSPVLRAMHVPDEVLRSALRLSFHALTSEEEVREATERILAVVKRLRHSAGR